jgi:hypothetical protein
MYNIYEYAHYAPLQISISVLNVGGLKIRNMLLKTHSTPLKRSCVVFGY